MGNFKGPKNKIARRFNTNVWGRPRNPIGGTKSKHVPFKRGKKKTLYGIRLDEKQKLRYFYGGVREKQFHSYYDKARQKGGNIGDTFLQLLESRLDVIVYRLNLAPTIFAARQLVSHKHIEVNGKVVNISSYVVRIQDKVSVKSKSKDLDLIQLHVKKPERNLPTYLSFDYEKMTGVYEKFPERDEIYYPFILNESLIVEFYSK